MSEQDVKVWLDWGFDCVLSSGILYVLAMNFAKRFSFRLERFLFRWFMRGLVLLFIGGLIWILARFI